jgi:hypothetical protein
MSHRPVVLVLATLLLAAAIARAPLAAQGATQPVAAKPISALMVDIVVSRNLAEKRLSSTPYKLSVAPEQRSSLRIGGSVPIPQTTFVPAQKDDAKPTAVPLSSFSYRDIGTNIDVIAGRQQGELFTVGVIIEETSIYADDLAPPTTKTTGAPAFRRFHSSNTLMMRDGQTIEYTMATDRLTGEVYRVSVKVTVVN